MESTGTALMALSILAYSGGAFWLYTNELKHYESKKEFWKYVYKNAFTGLPGFIELIFWNIILLIAMPTGILWKVAKWMKQILKN